MYTAFFDGQGNLEVYSPNDTMIVKGALDAAPGDENYHPMMEWTITLMKHHGDWPEDPMKMQTKELVGDIH